MTPKSSPTREAALAPCPLCGKPPGTKVGPPAMARCIAEGCEGRNLAAVTVAEWNTRTSTPPSQQSGQVDGVREALEQARDALIKIRKCSISGCEEGYGKPEKWADDLFRSHGDVAAALKTIDAALRDIQPRDGEGVREPVIKTEGCIICANGNDLPESEYCRACGREGLAVGLRAAVIKARGRQEPPRTPVKFASQAALPSATAERDGIHPAEKLWREHGLPEWFLGNGGTNTKLYEFYDAIRALSVSATAGREEIAIRAAQIDEQWRQALRELRDLSIDEGSKEIERRCFDLIMFGPAALSGSHP